MEAAPAWLRSSPPKRLFGLVSDVTPGKADVMQVAIGPLGQFAPLALTLSPVNGMLRRFRPDRRGSAAFVCVPEY